MASVIYGKCYLWQMYYGKCNYGKSIYGKSIMANETEPIDNITHTDTEYITGFGKLDQTNLEFHKLSVLIFLDYFMFFFCKNYSPRIDARKKRHQFLFNIYLLYRALII